MDLVFFIKARLTFATFFFENASKPFIRLILAIENEEPPYVSKYDESGEPQYLQEWQDARTGLQSVGLTSLSMVASSLQLFLNDWVRYRLEELEKNVQYERKHKKGWFHAYCKILEEIGFDLKACPADLELIEQSVLARNRGQHPEELTLLQITHSRNDLTKYPNPYFVSDADQKVVELDNGELSWWLSPKVYVDERKLCAIITEVENLCEWLEEQYRNAPGA